MKKIIRMGILLVSSIVYSQVGINTEHPKSTLTVNGSYAGNYKSVAVDTNLTITDQFVNVAAGTTSSITVTLPDAVVADVLKDSFYGRVYYIKNTSSFDVTIKGNGAQLLQTGPTSVSNIIVLKSGQGVTVVKNSNNSISTALWDIFQQTSATNDNTFVVGGIKSFRAVVPANLFTANGGGTRKIMTGKAVGNTSTTDRRSAHDLCNAADQAKFIYINGLRMDFLESWYDTNTSPKLFNANAAAITYNISSLSTNDRYIDGANTNIAAGHYSFYIDGNDDFGTNIDQAEYVNAMLTFPSGEWYNCTWHATRDAINYYFYFTAQRLN
ncbi:hypothetical protein [Chryseobacterium sp.]|uniref:hypothetical protein n=1 Tax=Chryseobacterium sp. TaxID=1871047 RepID=UPI002FCC1714